MKNDFLDIQQHQSKGLGPDGDLASQYGGAGSFAGTYLTAAQAALSDAKFDSAAQSLHSLKDMLGE